MSNKIARADGASKFTFRFEDGRWPTRHGGVVGWERSEAKAAELCRQFGGSHVVRMDEQGRILEERPLTDKEIAAGKKDA